MGSRLAAEGPTVGVQGFVMLLGNETPLSLTLEIGMRLSRNDVKEPKCRPLSQARAPFPPTTMRSVERAGCGCHFENRQISEGDYKLNYCVGKCIGFGEWFYELLCHFFSN